MKLRVLWLICMIMIAGCRKEVDLLLFNGRIYTAAGIGSETVDALAIRSGRVEAAGTESVLRRHYRAAEEKNLEGLAVYPGFMDSHCHFYQFGLISRQADLTGTRSVAEILGKLAEHDRNNPSGWVLGHGWDQNDWEEKQFPTSGMLDELFPDKPVYLVRVDGHAAWINSRAMQLAGIHTGMTVEGGGIHTERGMPTGILIDNAMSLAEKLVPPPSRDEKVRALLHAERICLAAGLTTVSDAGLDKDIVILIDSLQKQGLLSIHVNAMLNPTRENIEYFINHGIYTTDKLTVRSVKLYVDGALGSRGGLMKEPYADDPGNSGIQITPTPFLREICNLAYDKGYQVCTHCIGDSANGLMLQLYAGILPENNDHRWRIEHAQVFDPADLPLFRKYRVIPSVQTVHATSDMYWAGQRLGPARVEHAYAYKTLLEQNGWLANGSDFPVESVNPLYGFFAAFARQDLKGYPRGGYKMQEALTRTQALQSMTTWAAAAFFAEGRKGSLEQGKDADLVILDRDIMTVRDEAVPEARVVETYIAGRKIVKSDE